MHALFPPDFVRAIQQLRIAARRAPAGGDHGEHPSRRAGAGMEFRDFRAYTPGDDLRRVDWNVYRRSHRLFLRQYDELHRLSVYILLDVSDSMFFEDPPRADVGRQTAAALAVAALYQHDQVGVYPFGRELDAPLRLASRGQLASTLDALAALGPGGPTDLPACLEQLRRLRLRTGLLAVVSDFFDPAGVDMIAEGLNRLRHRVVLVQLVRQADRDPAVRGDVELVDCEGGAGVRLTANAPALQQYRDAYQAFDAKLRTHAHRRAGALAQIDADAPVLPQLHRLFPGGVLRI